MAAKKRTPRRAPRKAAAKKGSTSRSKKKSSTTPTASDYLAQLRKLKGASDADFAMMSEDTILLPVDEFIPTGNLAIDRLIGGGWPIGRITEVASEAGVGKSTLIDQSIAQVQRMGGVACLIDTEKARLRKYSASLGVDVDRLIIHEAETVEQVFSGFEKFTAIQDLMRKDHGDNIPPMLIGWDSLGGTPTNAELRGEADDEHVASAAKVIKKNLRRLAQRIAKLRTSIVIANHFYQRIGFGGGKVAYGGKGVAYFSSLRLWLARTGQLKLSDGTVIGQEVEAKVRKTRITVPRPPVKTALIFGGGFDNSYSLFDWGKSHGVSPEHRWVVQSGAHCWLYPPDEAPIHFQRTYFGLGQLLTEHPKIYRAMAKQFLETS